jgi:DHA2 family methylenomycin A resistance protein-like MFS transporter
VALASLTFALIEAGTLGWTHPMVLAGFAMAAATGAAFVATERQAAAPMLPRELFSDPRLAAGTTVGLLLNLGFYGQLFVFNLYLQRVRGLSPELAGLALLPEAAVVSVSSLLSGRLTARTGPRPAMLAGLCLGAAGLLGLIVAGRHTPYALLVAPLVATGAGMAFAMPAATTAVVESAPEALAGVAAGLINAARQAGGVVGVAVFGSLVSASLLPGLHASMVVAGCAFGAGAIITALALPGRRQASARR